MGRFGDAERHNLLIDRIKNPLRLREEFSKSESLNEPKLSSVLFLDDKSISFVRVVKLPEPFEVERGEFLFSSSTAVIVILTDCNSFPVSDLTLPDKENKSDVLK